MLRQAQHDSCGKAEMLRQVQHDSIKQSGCFVALNIIGLRPQTRGLPIDGQVKHVFKEKQ